MKNMVVLYTDYMMERKNQYKNPNGLSLPYLDSIDELNKISYTLINNIKQYNQNGNKLEKDWDEAYKKNPKAAILWLFLLLDRFSHNSYSYFNWLATHCILETDIPLNRGFFALIPIYGDWNIFLNLFFTIEHSINKKINTTGYLTGNSEQFTKSMFAYPLFIKSIMINLIRDRLELDFNNSKAYDSGNKKYISDLALLLPSCNTSSKETCRKARTIYSGMRWSEAKYRKRISYLRKWIKEHRPNIADINIYQSANLLKMKYESTPEFAKKVASRRYRKFVEAFEDRPFRWILSTDRLRYARDYVAKFDNVDKADEKTTSN